MYTVLLVDDEPLIRMGLKKLIDWPQYGWRVVGQAGDGSEAMEFLSKHAVDLVITDLMMPGMDGIELSAAVRQRFPGISVVVLTGYDDFHLVQKSLRNAVADYLLKPIDENLLVELLVRLRTERDAARPPFPYEMQEKILDCIRQGSRENMQKAADELADFCYANQMQRANVQRILQLLRHSLGAAFQQNGWLMPHLSPLPDPLEDLAVLRRYLCEQGERLVQAVHPHTEHELVTRAKAYAAAHLSEDISLNQLARQFYVNVSYLSNLFKEQMGENYTDYVARLRIEAAERMLRNPSVSIGEVGERIGYQDQRYFSQFFKKHTGMTPSAFRQNAEKENAK